jgi:Domain of unknown function (DU1801).
MAEAKTQPTGADVAAFLQGVPHPVRRADGLVLDALFRKVTGWAPQMWGPSLVGYGRYHYVYASGREGEFLATGFSPRKAALSLYIMPGYDTMEDLRARLGKHKTGKACLYITKLADVDIAVVEEIIRRGLDRLSARYPVSAA